MYFPCQAGLKLSVQLRMTLNFQSPYFSLQSAGIAGVPLTGTRLIAADTVQGSGSGCFLYQLKY